MKITKLLECKLTPEELQRYGVQLALQNQELERLEDRKKRAMSQLKSEIDAAQAEINSIAQKLARGYEEREVECEILYNTPEDGLKTTRRTDTGETVTVVPMSKDEKQDLFINMLGARKDAKEFVFRDKRRCRMVSAEEYATLLEGLQPEERLEQILKDTTEIKLVDFEIANPEISLVVCSIDQHDKNKEWFDLYRYNRAPKAAPAPSAEQPRKEESAKDAKADAVAGRPGRCSMCGEEGRRVYYAGDKRMLCERCMEEKSIGRWSTQQLLDSLQPGEKFSFRADFGYGCTSDKHETTCFRISHQGGGWKFHHYCVGDYRVKGTMAYAWACHLRDKGGIEE